jgi:adenylate cyclase
MSEKYPPEKVVKYLNEYFSAMVEIIFKNNGVLDKFIGDGIMVEFGVPLEDNEQELNAVKTAIEMIQAVKELCVKWRSEAKNVPNIEIGVGIHTGMAVIGNIGSEKRFEYTAIGDTVNSASRIEQLTKELKTPILFSESTAQALKDKIKIKSMGAQVIRGKAEPINVYTIDET